MSVSTRGIGWNGGTLTWFRQITLGQRGAAHSRFSTFTQTAQLDRRNADGVHFVFGINAMDTLYVLAEEFEEKTWKKLKRTPRYHTETSPAAAQHSKGDAAAGVADGCATISPLFTQSRFRGTRFVSRVFRAESWRQAANLPIPHLFWGGRS